MLKLYTLSLTIDTMLGIFQACSAATLMLGGLTIGQGSLVFAVNALAVAILEFPTGSYADKAGRKRSTIIGLFLCALGFLFLMQKGHLSFSIIGMVFNGLGNCFISGAKDAWFVNFAQDKHPNINLETFSLNLQICGRIGVMIGAILGAYLLKIDPSYVWLMCACLCFTSMMFSKVMPHGTHDLTTHTVSKAQRYQDITGQFKNYFLSMIIVSGFVFGLEMGIRNAIAHPYILKLGGQETMFLAYAQIINAATRTAGILAYKFVFKNLNMGPQFVAIALGIFACVEIVAGFTNVFWIYSASYALAIFAMGWYFPIRFTLINSHISESYRATILSIDSLLLNLGAAITGILLYFQATSSNFHNFWFLGAFFLGVSSILAYGSISTRFSEIFLRKKTI